MERAYTVREIDDLRRAVRSRLGIGYKIYSSDGCLLPSAQETIAIEQTLRTHMLAGHTAQDLRDSEKAS